MNLGLEILAIHQNYNELRPPGQIGDLVLVSTVIGEVEERHNSVRLQLPLAHHGHKLETPGAEN